MSFGTVQAEKMTTESGYSLGAGNASSFKNRLINGGMVIDQRNAGASVATSSGAYVYTLDRWIANYSQTSKYTVQQTPSATETGYATRVAAGFANYLAVTSSSAYSVGASDYFSMGQKLEGYNMADLAWGTANAKTVVLSFWVYSSLTGTFGGCVGNGNFNRSYPFTYTVNSANTWTQVSVTIPGDQSGTWNSTNGVGMSINWGLGVGSTYTAPAGSWTAGGYISANSATNVVSTNGATWYLTGVQLEVGTVATSFDFRSIGTEYALCQRYYQKWLGTNNAPNGNVGCGLQTSTSLSAIWMQTIVPMRATPTATISNMIVSNSTTFDTAVASASVTSAANNGLYIETSHASTGTTLYPVFFRPASNTTGYIALSSEL